MDKNEEDSIEFVKTELLPEAVQNRCFCEDGSREFVEFVTAIVEPLKSSRSYNDETEYYRARLKINFSGESTTFSLIIKLLSRVNSDKNAYYKFMNEEMFYSKMTMKYNLNIYPKCYVADMGRYGRPVIVLEDLESCGYVRVDSIKLDEYHLVLCLKAIGRFHRRGLTLKAQNFDTFREFKVKLIDTRLDKNLPENFSTETFNRILDILKKLGYEGPAEIELEKRAPDVTICHGRLALGNSFFFLYENGKPMDVRVIGWNGMRYCSIVNDLVEILENNLSKDEIVERLLAAYIDSANK